MLLKMLSNLIIVGCERNSVSLEGSVNKQRVTIKIYN